jgi:hypothetical protein
LDQYRSGGFPTVMEAESSAIPEAPNVSDVYIPPTDSEPLPLDSDMFSTQIGQPPAEFAAVVEEEPQEEEPQEVEPQEEEPEEAVSEEPMYEEPVEEEMELEAEEPSPAEQYEEEPMDIETPTPGEQPVDEIGSPYSEFPTNSNIIE